jgi:hypothetical protein
MISATFAHWNPYNPSASATLVLPLTVVLTDAQAFRNETA